MTRLERLAIAKMLADAVNFVNPYAGDGPRVIAYREGHTTAYTGLRDRLEWITNAKAEDLKKYIR